MRWALETAQQYAIGSVDEAEAYLGHTVLGPRLVECAETALRVHGRSATEIFGQPDNLKFHSSMTLFADVAPHEAIFPGTMIFLTVLSINYIGDGLRDALDPRKTH